MQRDWRFVKSLNCIICTKLILLSSIVWENDKLVIDEGIQLKLKLASIFILK